MGSNVVRRGIRTHTPILFMDIGSYIYSTCTLANGGISGGEQEAQCFMSVRPCGNSRRYALAIPQLVRVALGRLSATLYSISTTIRDLSSRPLETARRE